MPVHTCEVCGKKLSRSTKLSEHRRSHTGERPFKCLVTTCGKSFSRSYDLTKHGELHSGSHKYRCAFEENGIRWGCGKGFHKKGDLNRHLKRDNAAQCRQASPAASNNHSAPSGSSASVVNVSRQESYQERIYQSSDTFEQTIEKASSISEVEIDQAVQSYIKAVSIAAISGRTETQPWHSTSESAVDTSGHRGLQLSSQFAHPPQMHGMQTNHQGSAMDGILRESQNDHLRICVSVSEIWERLLFKDHSPFGLPSQQSGQNSVYLLEEQQLTSPNQIGHGQEEPSGPANAEKKQPMTAAAEVLASMKDDQPARIPAPIVREGCLSEATKQAITLTPFGTPLETPPWREAPNARYGLAYYVQSKGPPKGASLHPAQESTIKKEDQKYRRRAAIIQSLKTGMSWGGVSVGSWIRDE